MKTKISHLVLLGMSLGVLLLLGACRSEYADLEQSGDTSRSTTATEPEPLGQINLNLRGLYSEGAPSDDLRAIKLTDADKPRFVAAGSDWTTHAFIRNADGTKQFYSQLSWVAATGANGSIALSMDTSQPNAHVLTLTSAAAGTTSADLPRAGETWYIAAIAGGGVRTGTQIDFSFDASLDDPTDLTQMRVPLTTEWVPFRVADVDESAPKVNLRFKPQGTLVKVKLVNKVPLDRKGRATQLNANLKVESTQLQRGVLDFALQPGTPTGTPYVLSGATDLSFTKTVSLATQDASQSLLLWGMPKTTGTTSVRFEHLKMAFESTKMSAGTQARYTISDYTGFSRKAENAFQSGMAYYIETNLLDYRRPLEYVALGDFTDNTFSAIETTHLAPTTVTPLPSNLIFYDDVRTRGLQISTIDGVDYIIPSQNQLRAVIPMPENLRTHQTSMGQSDTKPYPRDLPLDKSAYNLSVPNLWAIGQIATEDFDGTIGCHVRWRHISKNLFVAIAHADSQSFDSGAYLSAYMLRLTPIPRPAEAQAEMTAVYIGRDTTIPTLDTLTEGWFNSQPESRKTKRLFALKGYVSGGLVRFPRLIGDYHIRPVPVSQESSYMQFYSTSAETWIGFATGSAGLHMPVRPYRMR